MSHTTLVCKALGHPARLRMLVMLRDGSLCACQLTAVLDLAASTVSAHLAELKRAGLVVEHRDGRWVSYRLAQDPRAAALLERTWGGTRDDPRVRADARLVRRLRRIPVEQLCRVELDVSRLGLKRPRWKEHAMKTAVHVQVIEILGPGCASCRETHRLVKHVVEHAGLECQVQKNESIDRMVELGVLRTPAVAFDGRVVHEGSIPKSEDLRRLLGLA